jgi:hypothetical protein
MPIEVREKFDSRRLTKGSNPSAELAFVVLGTDDDIAARDALEAEAPETYDALPRQTVQVEPLGPEMWDCTVRYSRDQGSPPATGESSFNFDTSGGTQHITQSLETVASYAAPGQTAPDFMGAIGVTNDGVEGVDITVPVYSFSETHYKADSEVTPAYKGALFRLTGKVNDATFKGFDPGEVLFLGASGSRRTSEDWEITFRFAASPNATDLSVGEITGISKGGWEYLWVRYTDSEDQAAKALVKRPVAAFVERVYAEGDFSALEID